MIAGCYVRKIVTDPESSGSYNLYQTKVKLNFPLALIESTGPGIMTNVTVCNKLNLSIRNTELSIILFQASIYF